MTPLVTFCVISGVAIALSQHFSPSYVISCDKICHHSLYTLLRTSVSLIIKTHLPF